MVFAILTISLTTESAIVSSQQCIWSTKKIGDRKQRKDLYMTHCIVVLFVYVFQVGKVLQCATNGIRQMLLAHKLIQTLHLAADTCLAFDGQHFL